MDIGWVYHFGRREILHYLYMHTRSSFESHECFTCSKMLFLFIYLCFNLFILFIYFWLHWVFVAARRLSLVAASSGSGAQAQ